MDRYVVVKDEKDGLTYNLKDGEYQELFFDTLEEANKVAQEMWNDFKAYDKHKYWVYVVEEDDKEERHWKSEWFDSDNILEEMGSWSFDNGISVEEEDYNFSLHCFDVYQDDVYLGTVYPDNIKDMCQCIDELNNGSDPITGGWDDGCGNGCTLRGWNSDGEERYRVVLTDRKTGKAVKCVLVTYDHREAFNFVYDYNSEHIPDFDDDSDFEDYIDYESDGLVAELVFPD